MLEDSPFRVSHQKVPDPIAMICLYNSQIRTKMGDCYNIWVGPAQSFLYSFDGRQKCLHGFAGNEVFNRTIPFQQLIATL